MKDSQGHMMALAQAILRADRTGQACEGGPHSDATAQGPAPRTQQGNL